MIRSRLRRSRAATALLLASFLIPVAAYAETAAGAAASEEPKKAEAPKPDGAAKPDGRAKPGDAAKPGNSTKSEAAGAAKTDAKPGAAKTKESAGAKPGADDGKPGAKPGFRPVKGAKADDAATKAETEQLKAEIAKRRHGERSTAPDGTLLVWDDVHGIWIAAQLDATYFAGDSFFRHRDGVWYRSEKADGPYQMIAAPAVPRPARSRHGDPKVAVTAKLPSGVDAVYDPRIKVYKITGHKGVFLHDASFWRYDDGVWYASDEVGGPWRVTSALSLPQVLRRAITPPEKGRKVKLPTGEVLISEGEDHLFALEGKPDVVFYDGSFYERRSGKWYRSEGNANEFEEISSQKIPQVVRQKYHVDKPKKSKDDLEDAKAGAAERHGAIRGERNKGAKVTKPAKEAKPAREQRAAQPAE